MTAQWCGVERDFVAVRGPDAADFLHGQCSQDVLAFDAGASAWSFVLQPTGKVDVLCRIHRVNDDAFVLCVDGGFGDALTARLQRFKLRVRAEIERVGWQSIAVVGAGVAPGPGVLVGWWGGVDGADLAGPSAVPPEGAVEIDGTEFERLRIEAGWPAMGAELTAETIPAESGVVPVAVSFTKGCYTGQELVARIDSRGGHVPRHLRRLRLTAEAMPGDRLTLDGQDVGWLTSVAGDLALGYVARAVEPPATVTTGGRPAAVEAIVAPSAG